MQRSNNQYDWHKMIKNYHTDSINDKYFDERGLYRNIKKSQTSAKLTNHLLILKYDSTVPAVAYEEILRKYLGIKQEKILPTMQQLVNNQTVVWSNKSIQQIEIMHAKIETLLENYGLSNAVIEKKVNLDAIKRS